MMVVDHSGISLPFETTLAKAPSLLENALAVRMVHGRDAEIRYLRSKLAENNAPSECYIELARVLCQVGRSSEAGLLLSAWEKTELPDWLSIAIKREKVFVCASHRYYEMATGMLVDYCKSRGEDPGSLWVQVTKHIASNLDPRATRQWVVASKSVILGLTRDKIRIERYALIADVHLAKQLEIWSTSDDIARFQCEVVKVEFRSVASVGLFQVHDFTSLLYEEPEEPRLLKQKTASSPGISLFGDEELRGMQTVKRLGWEFTPPPDSCALYSLPNARIATFETDHRGAFVYSQNLILQELCNEHHLVTVSSCCVVYREQRVIDVAYAPFAAAPGNYYHEIIDAMSSMMSYFQMARTDMVIVPNANSKFIQLYTALGIPESRIQSFSSVRDVVFRKLLVARPIPLCGTIVTFLRWVGEQITVGEIGNQQTPTCIYISRSKSIDRPLLNEHALEDMLLKKGFYILYAEDHSVPEQVAIFTKAEIVVAPHGAGLTNIVFCGEGSTVIEIVPSEYPADSFFRLAAACGHMYIPLLGTNFEISGESMSGWNCSLREVDHVVTRVLDLKRAGLNLSKTDILVDMNATRL